MTWCSFEQRCVPASSIGAGYVCLAECVQTVQYFPHILRELGGLNEPSEILEDNRPFILWATKHGKPNKHMHVRDHIFKETAMSGELSYSTVLPVS